MGEDGTTNLNKYCIPTCIAPQDPPGIIGNKYIATVTSLSEEGKPQVQLSLLDQEHPHKSRVLQKAVGDEYLRFTSSKNSKWLCACRWLGRIPSSVVPFIWIQCQKSLYPKMTSNLWKLSFRRMEIF